MKYTQASAVGGGIVEVLPDGFAADGNILYAGSIAINDLACGFGVLQLVSQSGGENHGVATTPLKSRDDNLLVWLSTGERGREAGDHGPGEQWIIHGVKHEIGIFGDLGDATQQR